MATVRCIAKRSVDTATGPQSLLVLSIPYSNTTVASRLADEVTAFIYDIYYTILHQTGNSNNAAIILPHRVGERIGMAIILLWRRSITSVRGNTI